VRNILPVYTETAEFIDSKIRGQCVSPEYVEKFPSTGLKSQKT
jgi:hypothetical protein